MALRRYSALLCLALFACVGAAVEFARSVADFVRTAIDVIASPFMPVFALEGWGGDVSNQRSTAIDPALQHNMRHEAGVSRRSAARHI